MPVLTEAVVTKACFLLSVSFLFHQTSWPITANWAFQRERGLEEGGAETVLSTEGAALMNSMREKKICFLNMKERASVKAQALNKIDNL